MAFEHAYCLYRLNKMAEAYELLKSIKDADFRVKELLAQAVI